MVKAVLFDFDGVLTIDATGSYSICNYISKNTNIDKDLFQKEYYKYNEKLLYGKINHKDIWSRLCENLGQDIPFEILEDSFINTPIDTNMMKVVYRLKEEGYKIAMVTDNKKDRIDSVVNYYKLNEVFDTIIVSAEIGSGKKERDIFIQTIKKLQVEANECVFIDNNDKNLIAPKKMGMKVIYFDDYTRNMDDFLDELFKFGVKI
ncbi:HAD-superfamily hydrolase, subfamily IA,variant 3 [Clostridium bornimense]|uniref:HAD-superfamily hydrolase, subfamily IA,variant 3 n=1 Tax=Clostridium bornimense TaxID=1216932 RepID=W6RY20_9CLOT|nr:HAD-IA family hydrolase [Clostridium bornimense]CDM69358.1 HAD-superfamily hydrolase, subfamily IA,variant 3 [Clostridium bornimense]